MDYKEKARKLCERGHGYGDAVDPTCGNCRAIEAALHQCAAEAYRDAAKEIEDGRGVIIYQKKPRRPRRRSKGG